MLKTLSVLIAALALTSCATLHSLDSDVSTYSQWPADRKPASYVFERLPSQLARAEQQQQLEDAARPALEAAGFTAATDDASADVRVQLGARVNATERSPYDDPFWWQGGLFRSRHGGTSFGTGFGFRWGTPIYNYGREVALLIRDRQSGLPLFEARASNDGASPNYTALLPAMFEAALKDFPNGGVNPRRVTVELPAP